VVLSLSVIGAALALVAAQPAADPAVPSDIVDVRSGALTLRAQVWRLSGAADGIEGRNRLQLDLLEHEEMNEAVHALARLRGYPGVDPRRIGVVGHSFGGSLSLLLAARDREIRAAVLFSAAAGSWNQSPVLRERLLAAVGRMSAAAFFIHAENDYSTASGPALAAAMQRLGKPQVWRRARARRAR
jgi:dienelactone hydrolase